MVIHSVGYADYDSWTLGIGCEGSGTFGESVFSACNTTTCSNSGFASGGSCSRTSTRFTKLTFTTFAGGTLRSTTSYALHTGDVLITPAILTTEQQPVFTVQSACPVNNSVLNWIIVQWDPGARPLDNVYLLGTSTYNTVSGVILTGQYDISGALLYAGSDPMPGTCVNGVYSTSNTITDRTGTVYFTANAGGVYKTNLGHAVFFFPQSPITLSTALASKTAQGIAFDSRLAANTSVVRVTTNASGNQFTVTPYTNPDIGDVSGAPWNDIISISAANSPQNGMLIGTIARNGGPSRDIACIVNKNVDTRVICSGESPADPNYPYTVTFVVEEGCPTNYVRVPKNPAVGVYSDFCVAKYEMKIQGNNNGNQTYNAAFVAESRNTGTAWVSINRNQSITECQAIGVGYDLISNAQWQAVARNIEDAYSNNTYLNWSNGRQDNSPSQNNINQGHTDSAPGSVLAASAIDSEAYYCTNNDSCTNNMSGTFSQKRTHQLSNGQTLWDFSGNAWEWVKDDNTATQGTDGSIYLETWNSGGKVKWGPRGTYTAAGSRPKTTSPFGGFGYGTLNWSAGGNMRGGGWNYGANSGVFATFLFTGPTSSATGVGFRCVHSP